MRNPVANLRRRIEALEQAVEENRRLSFRLEELVDAVAELLVPMAERDEERVPDAVGRFQRIVEQDHTPRTRG